jgi:hypothetical protein
VQRLGARGRGRSAADQQRADRAVSHRARSRCRHRRTGG